MAAPTTSVLTSFPGADEDPLSESGAWAGPVQNGARTLRLASNSAARSNTGAVGSGQSYRTSQTYGPDVEAFATISTLPESAGGEIVLWARIHNPNDPSTMEAYLAAYTVGTGFRIFKCLSGATFTQIGSTDATVASAGDKIFLEIIGNTLTLYHFTGGSWVARVTGTDSSITTAGYIGLGVNASANGRADDFGGGTISGGGPTGRRDVMLLLGAG